MEQGMGNTAPSSRTSGANMSTSSNQLQIQGDEWIEAGAIAIDFVSAQYRQAVTDYVMHGMIQIDERWNCLFMLDDLLRHASDTILRKPW
jgi:hypothetical protein